MATAISAGMNLGDPSQGGQLMRVISGALVFLLGLSGFATLACADTLIFKNGDKLSGTFVEVHDKKLSFKSDAVGDVSIPLEKIQSLSVEKPAVILGMDGRVF